MMSVVPRPSVPTMEEARRKFPLVIRAADGAMFWYARPAPDADGMYQVITSPEVQFALVPIESWAVVESEGE